ncbi:hypothetical protein PV10_03299 [Exophiala mesophila]|uniref:Acylphosphatase n=1 Tax=Exophiala mesophila TaxID=212818 RepID=A0A0D1X1N1_EXOME|nr:uncharacterized protein PV10_03299 [Exophiala mesophila]KIV95675.1 hypothetical protein PV10_03299 [Exophiala mesophila]
MAKRVSFTVHGTVQGVCFRDFTRKKATSYGLTGFVRNTSDGKVKGEAQGEEDSLKKLKGDLNEGPRAAHVVKLEFKEIDSKDGESSFIVS